MTAMELDPTATKELRKLEKYVRTLPSLRRMTSLPHEQRILMSAMQNALLQSIKLHNDAATADKAGIMAVSIERCVEQLNVFQIKLLAISEYGLVDTVDVAHLSAISEQVISLISRR